MFQRWIRRARRLPAETAAAALVVAVAVYVIGGPLLTSRYPLMIDLPQHAANASVLRHYFDADWHFREQLVIQPFSVPYMLFYGVAAAFMLVLSPLAATKLAVFVMLALLPAGLATLFWGMRKSPLLGVSGLVLCWGSLASWGFLNFVGALGLWAMTIGIALRAIDRPPREATLMLLSPLALLFFAHPFRFPMAIGALAVVMGLSHVARNRFRALLPPTLIGLVVAIAWWFARPPELLVSLGDIGLNTERLAFDAFGEHPYRSLRSGVDEAVFHRAMLMIVLLAVLLAAHHLRAGRKRSARRLVAHGTVAACLLAAGLAYLVLPMEMGSWWFIYPRESTALVFLALALLPDLPRRTPFRLGAVLWLVAAVAPLGAVAIDSHRAFAETTSDFERVTAHIPHAPKLMYLVFDRSGAPTLQSPFLHLPAYVTMERGGWSSFSFAWLGHSPLRYRDPNEPGAVVPPRPPPRWEWTPHRFELHVHGEFYEWFLVRSKATPVGLFETDPRIELVAHEGRWWLFHRGDAAEAP